MKIEEYLSLGVAEYELRSGNVFEDIINGQQKMQFNDISAVGSFTVEDIPLEFKDKVMENKEPIQEELDDYVIGFCDRMNQLTNELQYRKIKLDYPNKIYSAVMQYKLVYGEYKPTKIGITMSLSQLKDFMKSIDENMDNIENWFK